MAAGQRSFAGGKFVVTIDGYNVNFIKKCEPHNLKADIATHNHAPQKQQSKNVANISYTPAKLDVGIGMGKSMLEWIQAAFDHKFITKHGMITAVDFDGNAITNQSFEGALITKIGLPAFEGSSKESAYFNIEWQSEKVRWEPASGKAANANSGVKQKAWLCSNYRIEIGDLPCDRVSKIDAITYTVKVQPDHVGIFREHTLHPTAVEISDIKLTISHADHAAWWKKAKDWFIDGHHLQADEMQGRIVFLGPDLKEELGELNLINLGFKEFTDEPMEANKDAVKRFSVTLYVEGLKLTLRYTDA
jgi:hypothetical protein